MQTPTTRFTNPQKPSPESKKAAVLKLKTSVSDYDSSPKHVTRTPKDRSPKPKLLTKGPRTLTNERKLGKGSEMEATQLSHLREELKKAKNLLTSSESSRIRYQLEAEETKRKLAAVSAKLDETEKQLEELSENEDARVRELRKISHDRDRAWQSELEAAVQRQHALDSAALASAMNEINKLRRIRHGDEKNGEALRNEVFQLRFALRGAERMYHEEYVRKAELEARLKESVAEAAELRRKLTEAEDGFETVLEQNAILKSEIVSSETERHKAVSLVEESERSYHRKAQAVAKELSAAAAEASNSEMERELRKVKVQCEQWRKAAEAAAAMMVGGSSPSKDVRRVSCRYSDDGDDGDDDDDGMKKRNGNMLKKIRLLLLKKQQK